MPSEGLKARPPSEGLEAHTREVSVSRWFETLREILDRAPTRALPLTTLRLQLRAQGVPMPGGPAWLRKSLEENDGFRVIPARRGPWARWATEAPPMARAPEGTRAGDGRGGEKTPEAWILLRQPVSLAYGPRERTLSRIREGLLAWGEELDEGSPSSVARWIRANRQLEILCRVLQGGKP